MPQMRSLVERVVDSEKWAERLQAEEYAEYWELVPYNERKGLTAREVADMRAKREMRKLELVVLGEGDK